MNRASILFLVDSESQLESARRMAGLIAAQIDGQVKGVIIRSGASISARQLKISLGHESLRELDMEDVLDEEVSAHQVVVAYLSGSRLFSLNTGLRKKLALAQQKVRPILVTGYNGVVYEKHLEGLLWRVGFDVIAVNSGRDATKFAAMLGEMALPSTPLVVGGLPQGRVVSAIEPISTLGTKVASPQIKGIMFACQAAVPEKRMERVYLLSQMHNYALAHPDRKVIIKPRTLPSESTFRREDYHYEPLYERFFSERPPNLSFEYGSFSECLAGVNQVISVSSTAVLETVAAGKLGGVLTDIGIKETLGNHFFVGSGLLTTIPALIAGDVPQAHRVWLEEHGVLMKEGEQTQVGARVSSLLDQQRERGSQIPFLDMYFGKINTPFYALDFLKELPLSRKGRQELRWKKFNKFLRHPIRFLHDAWKNLSQQHS